MNNPLVSIIIPNYNGEKYIKQCIESIEMQTYHPIEIVIVDDKSTDASLSVIKSLAEQYSNIVVLPLESNGGVSNARNVGAQASTGEYMCFLDSDDFFYANDKIELEMNLIRKYLECGKRIIAYSGVACVNEQGKYIENRGLTGMLEGNIASAYIAQYKDYKHPRNTLADRELFFETGLYNTAMSLWEDDDKFIRSLIRREIYFTGKLGTAYRWKTTGLSHQRNINAKLVLKEIRRKYYKELSFFGRLKYYFYRILRLIDNTNRIYIPQIKHELSVLKHKIVD